MTCEEYLSEIESLRKTEYEAKRKLSAVKREALDSVGLKKGALVMLDGKVWQVKTASVFDTGTFEIRCRLSGDGGAMGSVRTVLVSWRNFTRQQ